MHTYTYTHIYTYTSIYTYTFIHRSDIAEYIYMRIRAGIRVCTFDRVVGAGRVSHQAPYPQRLEPAPCYFHLHSSITGCDGHDRYSKRGASKNPKKQKTWRRNPPQARAPAALTHSSASLHLNGMELVTDGRCPPRPHLCVTHFLYYMSCPLQTVMLYSSVVADGRRPPRPHLCVRHLCCYT